MTRNGLFRDVAPEKHYKNLKKSKSYMKFSRISIVYLTLSCFLFIFGCREDSAIIGFDLAKDGVGSVDSTIIIASTQATFSDTVVNTGSSQFLEIGQTRNLRTFSLLKFDTISDTATILAAKLLLNTNTLFSDGNSKSAYTATIHKVLQDWADNTVRFETRPNYEQSPLSSATIVSSAASSSGSDTLFTETVTFEFGDLGIDLIQSWQDSLNDNFGFFIGHENSNFIKEFFSGNSSINQPRLELQIENSNGSDTVFVIASEDAYIFEHLSPLPDHFLYTDNLFTNATVLKFDLSAIPKQTVVNDALLKINFNEDISIIKASGFGLRIDLLAEPYSGQESVRIDSSFAPILDLINPSLNPTTISIGTVLQFWLTENLENHGILIRALTPGSDISRVAFHSNNTNMTLAPRIEAIISSATLGN